ncbi:MAG: hypothetical protein ACE37F_05390 [Nannocystaceae bacterium]|nr:hypothetical protein [bacterium]
MTDGPTASPTDSKPDAERPSEPAEAAAASNEGGDPSSRSGLSAQKLRIARALLAPVLVAGAVGVHFSVNVPEEKVVMPKRDKKKPKRARRSPRSAIVERTPEQMDAAWTRWKEQPYDGEPIKGKWGRRMQTTVNKAVVLARKEAFEGAPEDPRVVVSGTQCRTVRCRFVLRSPFEHEPGLVVEALTRQTYEDELLWRTVEAEPTDPPTPHSPKKDHYLQVTLGVRFDAVNTREIGFEPEKDAAD